MISIIVSSYIEAYYQQFSKSLNDTIGVPYELIKIDNPGFYSASKAYNMGAEKATYQILCFVHEDVIFHTSNWGQNVLDHFDDNHELGLIGIAGSSKKTYMPTGWAQYNKNDKINVIQRFIEKDTEHLSTYGNELIEYVKTIDGVFLIARKNVWRDVLFDEQIRGYHLYDLDFSLRVAQKYKVAVVYNVLIEHFSAGSFASKEWIMAVIDYHKNKNKAHLFDNGTDEDYLIRNAYYALLTKKQIAIIFKIYYVLNIGISKRSFFPALRFVLPQIGGFFENTYLKARPLFMKSKTT